MHSITTALENLIRHLSQEMPAAPGIHIYDIPFPLNDAFDVLGWLASQPVQPQFYWRQRNGGEGAAILGTVTAFPSLESTRQFLHQHDNHPDLRIWDLNAFEPQSGNLLLPQLEWRRRTGVASLRLHPYSDVSLREDAAQAIALISSLAPVRPFPTLRLSLTGERRWPEKVGWIDPIKLATQTIAEGGLDKVVLARAAGLQFSQSANAAAVVASSRRLNLSCYHFFMTFSVDAAFLGSSPERLYRRRDMALCTEALTGTVANHPEDHRAWQLGDWLVKDDKNQRENMLVVGDICQRLQGYTQTLDVLLPQVLRLRKVQCLRRCIWTELNQADDMLYLMQLQSTAAVAGIPCRLAREFIQQNEPFGREWYAGSTGYLSLHRNGFCVSLRSAKISVNMVHLRAGAGIVRGSDPEQEWQEVDNKAAGLRTLLQVEGQ